MHEDSSAIPISRNGSGFMMEFLEGAGVVLGYGLSLIQPALQGLLGDLGT
jgi:hypothetical protein